MSKSTAVGLDIGSSSIKIVQIHRAGSKVRIGRHGIAPIPFGSLEGGAIQHLDIVAESIRGLLSDSKIKTKDAVIAVAGQTVIVRHVKFPLMERSELAEGIKWESERYIPYPIDDASVDFEIVSRDEGNKEMEVMLVAAQKRLVETHIQAVKKAGLQPIAIDVQPFALLRSLGLLRVDDSKVFVIIDIGAGTTDLLIYKGGSPRFTRIIPVAGNRLTQAVADAFACSMEEAERLKCKHADAFSGAEDGDGRRVNDAISSVLEEMVIEIRRSIDYFRLQQRDVEIDQVIISGGGARMANMEDYLTRELGIRVKKGNPLSLVNTDNIGTDFIEDAPILAVSTGLALREVDVE